jgi:HSP20 family molecular chaperone IbpA
MNTQDDEESLDFEHLEKWLESYFLDPLTSHFDQTQFPIDLYETDKEWIVEALLTEYLSSEITVRIQHRKLMITAMKSNLSDSMQKRLRIIEFPFMVIDHKVTANFQNGVLEIYISKNEEGMKQNQFITWQ